jgi:hypothetical protein
MPSHVHTYIHGVHIYIHISIHKYIYTSINPYIHTPLPSRETLCLHIYIYTYTHTYTRTYIHAYTQGLHFSPIQRDTICLTGNPVSINTYMHVYTGASFLSHPSRHTIHIHTCTHTGASFLSHPSRHYVSQATPSPQHFTIV